MRAFFCGLVILLIPVGACGSIGTPPRSVPHFSLWVAPWRFVDSTGQWGLTMRVSDSWSSAAKATVRLDVGNGAVVEGTRDTTVQLGGYSHWGVRLRRTGPGPVTVRSSLRVAGKDSRSYDLYERLLRVEFQPWHHGMDTVVVQENRVLRGIAVRDGRRFRYGGERFVAIEADEAESPRDYVRRAAVVSSNDVRCEGCGLEKPVTVPVIVTVGSKGRVTWIRPNLGRERDPEDEAGDSMDSRIWAAVERGVRDFKYQPALADGRAVADYTTLDVRIVP